MSITQLPDLAGCCIHAAVVEALPWIGDLLEWREVRACLAASVGYAYNQDRQVLPRWKLAFGTDWDLTAMENAAGIMPSWIYLQSPTQAVWSIAGTVSAAQWFGHTLSATVPPAVVGPFSVGVQYQVSADFIIAVASALGISFGDRPTTFVGHSMGAPIAAAVMNRLKLGNPSLPVAWLSLAGPRVLGISGNLWLDGITGRQVVIRGDLVPYIPPAPLSFLSLVAPLPAPIKAVWALYAPFPSGYVIGPGLNEAEYIDGDVSPADVASMLNEWLITGRFQPRAAHAIGNYVQTLWLSRILDGRQFLGRVLLPAGARNLVAPWL